MEDASVGGGAAISCGFPCRSFPPSLSPPAQGPQRTAQGQWNRGTEQVPPMFDAQLGGSLGLQSPRRGQLPHKTADKMHVPLSVLSEAHSRCVHTTMLEITGDLPVGSHPQQHPPSFFWRKFAPCGGGECHGHQEGQAFSTTPRGQVLAFRQLGVGVAVTAHTPCGGQASFRQPQGFSQPLGGGGASGPGLPTKPISLKMAAFGPPVPLG